MPQEPPRPPRPQEETWRTGGALIGFLLFSSFSGTSTSSKTPGRGLEDRWSLDRVSAVSKFFRLQGETWRTGGVLIGFVMLDLDETYAEASEV